MFTAAARKTGPTTAPAPYAACTRFMTRGPAASTVCVFSVASNRPEPTPPSAVHTTSTDQPFAWDAAKSAVAATAHAADISCQAAKERASEPAVELMTTYPTVNV